MFALNQIYKITIKIYSNLSPIKINYWLKQQILKTHRHFSENFHKIVKMFKHIAMIEEILFILHFVKGWIVCKSIVTRIQIWIKI